MANGFVLGYGECYTYGVVFAYNETCHAVLVTLLVYEAFSC